MKKLNSAARLRYRRLLLKLRIELRKEKKVRLKVRRMAYAAAAVWWRSTMRRSEGAQKRWERRKPVTTFYTPLCPMQFETMKAM